MTGASRADWLRYRALWFSLLNQGFMRVGHRQQRLALAVDRADRLPAQPRLGKPRSGRRSTSTASTPTCAPATSRGPTVRSSTSPSTTAAAERSTAPTSAPFTVSPTATLKISVAAAPWIPVTEARVFVNGALAHTVRPLVSLPEQRPVRHARLVRGRQPAARDVASRQGGRLAGRRGRAPPGDARRHRRRRSARFRWTPIRPTAPADDPRFNLQAIAPGVWPTAFSNPFFLDLDGGGWTAPGLP